MDRISIFERVFLGSNELVLFYLLIHCIKHNTFILLFYLLLQQNALKWPSPRWFYSLRCLLVFPSNFQPHFKHFPSSLTIMKPFKLHLNTSANKLKFPDVTVEMVLALCRERWSMNFCHYKLVKITIIIQTSYHPTTSSSSTSSLIKLWFWQQQ